MEITKLKECKLSFFVKSKVVFKKTDFFVFWVLLDCEELLKHFNVHLFEMIQLFLPLISLAKEVDECLEEHHLQKE